MVAVRDNADVAPRATPAGGEPPASPDPRDDPSAAAPAWESTPTSTSTSTGTGTGLGIGTHTGTSTGTDTGTSIGTDPGTGTGASAGSGAPLGGTDPLLPETQELLRQGYKFQGAAIVALVDESIPAQDPPPDSGRRCAPEEDGAGAGVTVERRLEIVLEDGVMLTVELDSGERRLRELGYTQTLQRDLTGFELYSAGLICVSLFVGIVPYYGVGYANGGPVAVVWYWWIPGILANVMTLSLAEISSSFPLAGSMYFWAAHLAPPKVRPLASWITGYLELFGSSVGAGGTILAGVFILTDIINISNSVYNPAAPPSASASPPAPVPGWTRASDLTPAQDFAWGVGALAVVGAINFLRVKVVGQILAAAATYSILLALTIMICVPLVAPVTQSASFVFTQYNANWTVPNAAYAFVVALTFPQYALYSMDSAAHISEEAKRADVTTPVALVASNLTATVMVWGMIVALTFSIQNEANLSAPDTVTGGAQYFQQILWDVFYSRYGSGAGSLVIMGLIYITFFTCSIAQIMTAARVAYALARDRGLPFSSLFSRIDSRKVPIPGVLLTCGIALVSLIPSLFTLTAYYAVTAMATIGWFSAYAVPMYLRLVMPESSFVPGPFYMAKYLGVTGGKAVHLVGLIYVLYTILTFMIPTVFPIAWDTFNYAPLGMAVIGAFFLGWWLLDARRWFEGPPIQDKAMERRQNEQAARAGSNGSANANGLQQRPDGASIEWY